ncbi:MAG: hypothetical protein JXB04_10700 [Kiritimatiellae bacterium]|nr:hypothetical protein [Kiritimatiellia bacterium]
MRFSSGSLAILAALCAAVAWADAPARGFELRDQFGRRHEVAFPGTRVSVLAFADRAGSEQLESWVRPLYERYRDAVDIRGVAKLAGVPAALHPMLRAVFRCRLDYPVMMDWTGKVSADYRYEAGEANVMVLSPDGRIEYRFNGRATPSELKACFARIDELLAAPGPRAE